MNVYLNVNNFRGRIPEDRLRWNSHRLSFGSFSIKFQVPFWEDGMNIERPRWKEIRIKSLGQVGYPKIRGGTTTRCWWGQIEAVFATSTSFYPIVLDLITSTARTAIQIIATPPGKPGKLSTILVDKYGLIVPQILSPLVTEAKVLLISPDWKEFGWHHLYPTVALQFIDGVCPKDDLKIAEWHLFLMRNIS